jgi:hypothetical protein
MMQNRAHSFKLDGTGNFSLGLAKKSIDSHSNDSHEGPEDVRQQFQNFLAYDQRAVDEREGKIDFGKQQEEAVEKFWGRLTEMITGPEHEYVYLKRIITRIQVKQKKEEEEAKKEKLKVKKKHHHHHHHKKHSHSHSHNHKNADKSHDNRQSHVHEHSHANEHEDKSLDKSNSISPIKINP